MGRHFTHVFATFAQAGPQVRTTTILNALPPGTRHTIVAMDGNVEAGARLLEHVEWRSAAAPRTSSFVRSARQLAALLRADPPDLLLTYNWGAIEGVAAALLAGVRRRIHAEDGFGRDEAVRRKRRRVWARRVLLRRVDRVVVPSSGLLAIARSEYRVPRERSLLIRNGVDTEAFTPGAEPAWRRDHSLGENDVVVGTVAGLRPVKGLDLLIQAVARVRARHPALKLLIVGEGSERGALEALVGELDLEGAVVFAGQVADTGPSLRAMDVFALSSHSEQMPVSLLEAMACGLPALSTTVGDVALLVAEPNRELLVAGRDLERYAGALERLVADADLRRRLGAAQRAKCLDDYRVEAMIERYRSLYDEVLEA